MPKAEAPLSQTARRIARGEGEGFIFRSRTTQRIGGDRRIVVFEHRSYWDGPVHFGVVSGERELRRALSLRERNQDRSIND